MTHASRPADHDSHNVPASVEPPPLPAHLQDLTERARTYVKAGSSANTRRVCAGLALAVPDHTTLSRRA
ncbi:hypothetical protein GHK68_00200, partial [Sinorhizobium meliloti]|nr:hypothetical protein [Sinorhizobium meliloti]